MQGKLAVGFSEGIIGAAASTGLPVRVPDVTKEPRYRMLNPETRSELAIPMTHKGRVIGILDLESPQLNYFTEDHVQALSILAAQLAIALENARLYEKVARDEARMSASYKRLSACRAPCSGPFRWRILAWIWPRGFSPRAKSAAIFTIFCAMARRVSALAWATSAARAPRPPFMAPWPSAFCAASLRRSFCRPNSCASSIS